MNHYVVPDPILQTIHNHTPFAMFGFQKMGVGRAFCDCVVLKGTFRLEAGQLPLATEQVEVTLSDRYHDPAQPEFSSLQVPGDLHLAKPGTDVIVVGTARAPHGRSVPSWLTRVRVVRRDAPELDLMLRATGPRQFAQTGRSFAITEPQPANEIPLRYELAYGGRYPDPQPRAGEPAYRRYAPNPSGCGFVSDEPVEGGAIAAPRWELASEPVRSVNHDYGLAGYGPVSRSWGSRIQYAGTYDDAWRERVRREAPQGLVPDYAPDFDARFFHCAHPHLRAPTPFQGDEIVQLYGLIHDAPELSFAMPTLSARAEVLGAEGPWRPAEMPLDTVVIDLDARRVCLVWRLVLRPEQGIRFVLLDAHPGSPRPGLPSMKSLEGTQA